MKIQKSREMQILKDHQRKLAESANKRSFEQNNRDRKMDSDQLRYIRQAQKSAFDLDSRENLKYPENRLFWPPKVAENISRPKRPRIIDDDYEEFNAEIIEEDEEPEFDPAQLLLGITTYLREKYFFCIYCGATFSDMADLLQNCPGNSPQLHDEL